MPTRPGHSRASCLSASRSKRPGRLVRDHRIGHALAADQARERTGVDAAETDDAAPLEPLLEVELRAVARRRADRGLQDDPARARRRRHVDGLDVLLVGADVADMREGEGDDLSGIGGIGEDFLVAGHGGVEADFAHRMAGGAEAKSFEHGAVGEHQQRRRHGLRPAGIGRFGVHGRLHSGAGRRRQNHD